MDSDTFLQRLGRNLRTARLAKGLTLEQAAGGRGAYRYLWELELGKRNPSILKLLRLAEMYGVSPSDLLNIPGARPGKARLSDLKPEPRKRGRKPKANHHSGSR